MDNNQTITNETPPESSVQDQKPAQYYYPSPKKRKAQEADPVEKALLKKIDAQMTYIPNIIHHSVVTSDEVTDILHDIKIGNMEESIAAKSNPKVNKVSLGVDVIKDTEGMEGLTEYDRCVVEGVLAQLMAGNTIFTAAMLYRTISGRAASDDRNWVSAESRANIAASMRKCMYSPFRLTFSPPEGDNDTGPVVYEGPIIPAESVTASVSGVKQIAYKISSSPAIYRFCLASNNLTVTPIDLISVKEMSYTKRNLALLNKLQRTIAPLIYPPNGAPYAQPAPLIIPYSFLYAFDEDAEVDAIPSGSTTQTRIRNTVAMILNTWVRAGYLESWRNQRKGRAVTNVILTFPNHAPPATDALG